MSTSVFWRDLPVHKTLLLEKLENVKSTCDIMVRDYVKLEKSNNFSYRILLPRNDENNKLAKKIGLSLQLEFLNQLIILQCPFMFQKNSKFPCYIGKTLFSEHLFRTFIITSLFIIIYYFRT